jgi:hypothetical protein
MLVWSQCKDEILIDRLCPFVKNRKMEKKKAIVVYPSADGFITCAPLLKMFQLIFDYQKIEFIARILVTTYEKITQNKQEMNKAYEVGSSI